MAPLQIFGWTRTVLTKRIVSCIQTVSGEMSTSLINELAFKVGVIVCWDSKDAVILEGSWVNILQAQDAFKDYLDKCKEHSFENQEEDKFHSTDVGRAETSNVLKDSNKVKDDFLPVRLGIPNRNVRENEVYVNITLSTPTFPSAIKSNKYLNNFEEKRLIENDINEQHNKTSQDTQEKNRSFLSSEELQTEHSNINVQTFNIGTVVITNQVRESRVKKCEAEVNNIESKRENRFKDCKPDIQNTAHIIVDQNDETILVMDTEHVDTTCLKKEMVCDKDENVTQDNIQNIKGNSAKSEDENSSSTLNDISNNNTNCQKECDSDGSLTTAGMGSKTFQIKRKNYEELAPFKFFCALCSFKTKRESHYQRHVQVHEQISQIFECDKCSFKTIRLGNLRRHEMSHCDSEFFCEYCNYKTLHEKLLIRHQRSKHNNKNKKTEIESKEPLSCSSCSYSTFKQHLLIRHMKVHGSNLSGSRSMVYECSQCSYKTTRKEHLARHTNNVHICQRPFLCDHCGKAFKRPDALKQHASIHSGQANVKCPKCSKSCRSQAHLKQHMFVHSNKRLFLCELCGASFKTRAVQHKHITTIHQHPKSFCCQHCSRKFNTKFALRRHMKQHINERKPKTESVEVEIENQNAVVIRNPVSFIETDAVIIKENTIGTVDNQSMVIQEGGVSSDGSKLTMPLDSYETENVQVISSHGFVQHTNETATALLYLTGNFTY